jgi:hypothetical protein
VIARKERWAAHAVGYEISLSSPLDVSVLAKPRSARAFFYLRRQVSLRGPPLRGPPLFKCGAVGGPNGQKIASLLSSSRRIILPLAPTHGQAAVLPTPSDRF